MKSCNHFLWKIKLRFCFCFRWKNRRRQRLRRWWRQRLRQRFWQWQRQRQWRRQQRRQQQRLQRLQRGLAGLFFILILILHATLAFISWLARAPLEMEQAQIFSSSQARVLKVEPKWARVSRYYSEPNFSRAFKPEPKLIPTPGSNGFHSFFGKKQVVEMSKCQVDFFGEWWLSGLLITCWSRVRVPATTN